jgi:hypothetical protein
VSVVSASNDQSRAALHEMIHRLSPDDLSAVVDGAWPVSAVLGHLAFWDGYLESRWRQARGQGLLVPVLDVSLTTDVLNDTLAPILRGVPGVVACDLALAAAESIDSFVAALPEECLEAAHHERLGWVIDRSIQRMEHLRAIEQGLTLGRPT